VRSDLRTASRPAVPAGVAPRRFRLFFFGLLGLIALVFAGRWLGSLVPRFAVYVESLGSWGPIMFVVGYVIATVALVPGSLLTLAAGALFGIAKGTAIAFLAATLGASLAFLLSRYVARAEVERRLGTDRRFLAIDQAIRREGRTIVVLLRLSPIFPFNLLNYALGLTQVRFLDFVIASIGMLPGTLLYVYYGRVAGDVARLAAGVPLQPTTGSYLLLGIGLFATIAVTVLLTRTARRALHEAIGGPSGTT
jgi:uncharacterized membrane protein YdjX (TVP38/TMEM64 family)